MACDINVIQGRTMFLAIRNQADTAWELVGGLTAKNVDWANNSIDITSQSSVGDYTEKQFDGYSDVTIGGDYNADTRTGVTETSTGYLVASASRLLEIQMNPQRCCKVQLMDPEMTLEGEFTLVSLSRSGEQKGVISGSLSLESRSAVTLTLN